MNWVDAVVLVVVAFSGMLGFARGLVREVFGLAAWVLAALAAAYFFPQVQPFARRAIANPDVADPVAFGGIFLVVLVVFSLLARLLANAVRGSALGSLDRTLGLLFGLVRGAAILVAAYLIAGTIEPVDRWPEEVLDARSLPSIYLAAAWVENKIPEDYRPALVVPPAATANGAAPAQAPATGGQPAGTPPAR